MELVVTTVITVLVKGLGIKGIIQNIDIGAIRSEYPVSVEELGGIERFQPLGENREQETDSFRKNLGPLLTES